MNPSSNSKQSRTLCFTNCSTLSLSVILAPINSGSVKSYSASTVITLFVGIKISFSLASSIGLLSFLFPLSVISPPCFILLFSLLSVGEELNLTLTFCYYTYFFFPIKNPTKKQANRHTTNTPIFNTIILLTLLCLQFL